MRERTANTIIFMASAVCFAVSFILDTVINVHNRVWDIFRLVLIFAFFAGGIAARGVDHEKSGAWFKQHKLVQGITICLVFAAFGMILAAILLN